MNASLNCGKMGGWPKGARIYLFMVDFDVKRHDNVVDFSTGLDDRVAQNMRLSDDDQSPFAQPAYNYIARDSRPGKWGLMDFRLQALGHEDKVLLKIVGISIVITCSIMVIAFGVATAIVEVSRLF